ncbi:MULTISPECIES: hypothetical protein [unclassified Wolbachia]|nr:MULTISPECIES: hypothetical protein [unclassified Wolbachia]
MVNFLSIMAKDCTNVAITKAFLLGGCHPSAPVMLFQCSFFCHPSS